SRDLDPLGAAPRRGYPRGTMSPTIVHVNLGPRAYDVAVTSDSLTEIGTFARARCKGTLAVVIADEHVPAHAGRVTASLQSAGFRTHCITLPHGESQKSLTVAGSLYDALVD